MNYALYVMQRRVGINYWHCAHIQKMLQVVCTLFYCDGTSGWSLVCSFSKCTSCHNVAVSFSLYHSQHSFAICHLQWSREWYSRHQSGCVSMWFRSFNWTPWTPLATCLFKIMLGQKECRDEGWRLTQVNWARSGYKSTLWQQHCCI